MITSTANPRVKFIRSLHTKKGRESERCFVVEGLHLLEEAVGAGLIPDLVAYEPAVAEKSDRLRDLLRFLERTSEILAVDEKVIKAMAETTSPQGVIAVLPFRPSPPLARKGLALVLDEIQDPGNLGTIMRAADAAGAAGLILSQHSADPYNGKCLRAAAGAHFRLPILDGQAWHDVRTQLQGRIVYLAQAHGGVAHYDIDWTQPSAAIFGNEAHGASSEAKALADRLVSIPMPGETESLNVAMAVTVVLFESARQLEQKAATKRVGRTKPPGREGR